MSESEAVQHTYWQAHGLIEQTLSSFRAAGELGHHERQRAVFYRLATFHGRTLRVLNSGLHAQNEQLVQAALANLQALHRGMLQMHRSAPDLLPLPIALSAPSRRQFLRDMIMRVLVETPPALDVPAIQVRTNRLDQPACVQPRGKILAAPRKP
jgi:hypothetical protein